jgi:hypothetical protein
VTPFPVRQGGGIPRIEGFTAPGILKILPEVVEIFVQLIRMAENSRELK